MKLFIYELYLRDVVGLKDIKETSIKRVNKKECYIINISTNDGKIKLLQSYDRIVAVYDCSTNIMLVECYKLIGNKASNSYSVTTTKHINLFINTIINESNKTPILENVPNFDILGGNYEK